LLATLALVAAACGSDDSTGAEGDGTDTSGADGNGTESDSALPNACPSEGCEIFIVDAMTADGGEITLTFDANFSPEFERNHIHVFWDSQEPGAVSSDYDTRGFDIQGKWHPTDDYPTYITTADASVGADSRQGSTTVCVTAADTDHAVIDPGIVACRDVGELLSE